MAAVAAVLGPAYLVLLWLWFASGPNRSSVLLALGISWTFGAAAWALGSATPAAAVCGSLICLLLSLATEGADRSLLHSALVPLAALFVLTFAATRLGRASEQRLGLSEPPGGRNAAQVIANLGAAGLLAAALGALERLPPAPGLRHWTTVLLPVLLLAALAEATADTLSSEIGQVYGGTPWLLTALKAVAPGTDGAVSLAGTCAGAAAAALISTAGAIALRLPAGMAAVAFAAAVAGLFFDSLLGATVERRGWLGNDLVNFCSTLFAAACALLLLRL